MVRQATHEDFPRLVDLSKKFHAESVYRHVPFDEATVIENLNGALQGGGVFVNDEGFAVGILVPLMFNKNILVAAELAWYCPDGDGRELKNALEVWAATRGAVASQFSVLNNGKSEKLTQYLVDDGYAPIEIAFVKGLTV